MYFFTFVDVYKSKWNKSLNPPYLTLLMYLDCCWAGLQYWCVSVVWSGLLPRSGDVAPAQRSAGQTGRAGTLL